MSELDQYWQTFNFPLIFFLSVYIYRTGFVSTLYQLCLFTYFKIRQGNIEL